MSRVRQAGPDGHAGSRRAADDGAIVIEPWFHILHPRIRIPLVDFQHPD
jgi:hypothetical protein